mgnify:CR=1 FL=1
MDFCSFEIEIRQRAAASRYLSNYSTVLVTEVGFEPTPPKRLDNYDIRFTILENNLTNTRDRKSFEAVAITIKKPKLNAQVFHRKVSII